MSSTRLPYLQKVGWRKDQFLKVYRAFHLSVINYAAPALQLWLAPKRLDRLERCQNRALRIITGQVIITLLEALRIEAGVPSIASQAQHQAAVAYEKAHRLPMNHPRRTVLEEPRRHRLKRPSWRSTIKALTTRFPCALSSRDALKTLGNQGTMEGVSGRQTDTHRPTTYS